jgi:hypothetical protein
MNESDSTFYSSTDEESGVVGNTEAIADLVARLLATLRTESDPI